jgi:hypothetical protein
MARRRDQLEMQRLPRWADIRAVYAVYNEAALLRERGFDVEVDHKIPLNHLLVCGLHCEDNLQIVEKRYNAAKSNKLLPLYADNYEPWYY